MVEELNPELLDEAEGTKTVDLDPDEDPDEEGEEGEEGENGAKDSSAKTPVSLLQELFVRRGITPKYDLVQIEGAVHEPTFKYRVTVGEVVATGCGQSKKKAKHCAAKSILDKLVGAQNSGKAPAGQPVIPDLATEILSPYDDGIQGNPVGLLQELCMNRRWPPPTYDLSHEEGLPHERSFTINCIIEGKHVEVGAGKSKKLAKRQAADKMIKRLRELPQENEEDVNHFDDDDLVQGLGNRFTSMNLKELTSKSSSGSNFQQISRCHKSMKSWQGDNVSSLKDTDFLNNENDYLSLLKELAAEQKFEVTFVDIEEVSKSGKRQCLVQLSALPVSVCFGDGESSEAARSSAAKNALEYLNIMCK